MQIRRVGKPADNFTVISNEFIRAGLPPAAFQVGCYVMSHRDGYRLTRSRIAEVLNMARNTVARALAVLENAGYATVKGDTMYVSDTVQRAKIEQPVVAQKQLVLLKNDAEQCAEIEHHKKTTTKSGSKPRRKHAMPADWRPNSKHTEIARQVGMSTSQMVVELDKFKDWTAATGTRYIDWDAAFRNWLRNYNRNRSHTPVKTTVSGSTIDGQVIRRADGTVMERRW